MREDDPRYTSWLSRKPGAKKVRQERLASILGSRGAGVVGEEIARKATTAAGRAVATTARGSLRSVAAAGLPIAATALKAVTLGQVAALAGAGAVAYFVTRYAHDALDANYEQREQAALTAFVEARRRLMASLGTKNWADVPAEQRNKLVAALKSAQQQLRQPRVLEK